MGNDTNAGFRAGIEAAARVAEEHASELWDGWDIARFIRRLTPTASEATAIGAGEAITDRDAVGRDIRIAIWNAGMAGGMGQELTQAFIRRAMAEPMMKRALAAASPKVASDTAPGVLEAAERLLIAMTTRALRGRDHVPSMRDEQDAASALRAALSASPADASSDAGGVEIEVQYEVWQDDMLVAGSDSEAEGRHYLAVYGQDGPATLKLATTTRTVLASPAD